MSSKAPYQNYTSVRTAAPQAMTMDRMNDLDELIVAQSTQMCLRTGCCRPSVNWILQNTNNYEPGSSPLDATGNSEGWIHEESTFVQRCCFGSGGCRETRFVQHAGGPPRSMQSDEGRCCVVQLEPTSDFLSPNDLAQDIVAVHEKQWTCCAGSCCMTPYLRTWDGVGEGYLGETRFICDAHIFVPKFHVLDRHGSVRYLLRPDTCCLGLCILPRCGGPGGKCCRVPFLVRHPKTHEPMPCGSSGELDDPFAAHPAQVTQLWSGLVNEACFKRHAYHVAFPAEASPEDKMVLIGSSLLVDIALFENEDDQNNG